MHIIFGEEHLDQFKDRYTVLPLDVFRFPGQEQSIKSYCVIEMIPIDEIMNTKQYVDLHHKLMENYSQKNWKFCEDALEHLVGKWNSEIDSFYHEISNRIKQFKESDPGEDWSPVIVKS